MRCQSSILFAAASRASAFVPSSVSKLNAEGLGSSGFARTSRHRFLDANVSIRRYMSAADQEQQQQVTEKTAEEKERLKAEREAKK